MMLTASEEGGSGGGAEESSHHTTRLGIYIFKEVRRFGFKREEEGGGFVKFVERENSAFTFVETEESGVQRKLFRFTMKCK